jgi:flagellar motor switch protein FliM
VTVSPSAQHAVLGRRKPANRVEARDFGSPRRVAPERLRALAIQLENLLPDIEHELRESAGLDLGLRLDGLGERDADRIFEEASEPLCVLRFRVQEHPAWLAWDPAAAVGLIEAILGGSGENSSARQLSPTEATLAAQFLVALSDRITAMLGLSGVDPVLVQARSELGSWREGGADAEPHRLVIRLVLVRGSQESALVFYLPGVGAGDDSAGTAPLPEHLPGHLDQVEIEVSARLSGCEISLDQLLALEEGDVIPLDARVGDPTDLCVDGKTLAEGRLGSHRGRLAVRIERMKVVPETLG